jgi:hypothetical protein
MALPRLPGEKRRVHSVASVLRPVKVLLIIQAVCKTRCHGQLPSRPLLNLIGIESCSSSDAELSFSIPYGVMSRRTVQLNYHSDAYF